MTLRFKPPAISLHTTRQFALSRLPLDIILRTQRPAIEHVLQSALDEVARTVPEVRFVHAVEKPHDAKYGEEDACDALACLRFETVERVGVENWVIQIHFAGLDAR